MTYFYFFYSILLTLLFGACGFGFLLLYKRSGHKRDFWLTVMFFIFTCDNLLLSMMELIPAFHEYYLDIVASTPFPSSLVTIAMVFSYRMVVAYAFDRPPSKSEKIFQIFLLVALLVSTSFSYNKLGRIVFLSLIQFCMIAILYFGFKGLRDKHGSIIASEGKLWFYVLVMSSLTHAFGAYENFFHVFSAGGSTLPRPRIISLEIFGLFCVAFALYHLLIELSRPKKDLSEIDLMNLFSRHYALTAREADLVPLLLKGSPNSEICETLCIALNTVKVHTHNIYRKLGIERRSQLAAKYSEYTASRDAK